MKSIGNITIFSNRTLTVVPYLENKRQRLFCSGRLPQFLIVITFVCCCFVFKCVRRREMLTLYLLGTKQTILLWKTSIVSDRNNGCLLLFFQMRAQTTNVDIIYLGTKQTILIWKTPIVSDRNNCCLLLFFQMHAQTTNVDIISFGNEIDYFASEDSHSFRS